MNIRLLKPVNFKTGQTTQIGKVVNVEQEEATRLISLEAAEPVDEKSNEVEDMIEAKIDSTEILQVKGVTKKIADSLVQAGFNSIASLQKTTVEQLFKIKGITKIIAEEISKDAKKFDITGE